MLLLKYNIGHNYRKILLYTTKVSLYSKSSIVADSRTRVYPGTESFSRIGFQTVRFYEPNEQFRGSFTSRSPS